MPLALKPPQEVSTKIICGLLIHTCPASSPLWREEIFGPVLCVRVFDREDEAIAMANDSDFGLVATIVGADDTRTNRVALGRRRGANPPLQRRPILRRKPDLHSLGNHPNVES
jgi:acyl-CoA reductase-like NAD-dependent aldehyde dehydrogenase